MAYDGYNRERFTSAEEIKPGLFVLFRCDFDEDAQKYILTGGFIRSVHQGRAQINAPGRGMLSVPRTPEWIRYNLTK